MAWQEPIYDRTEQDVKRVQELLAKGSFKNLTGAEQQEFLAGLKGSINLSDLTRIWENLSILASVYELDITIPNPTLVLTQEYMTQLEEVVELIRGQQKIFTRTPATPAQPYTNYKKWNDIEQIIADVYLLLNNNFFNYCGEGIYSGETIGLI